MALFQIYSSYSPWLYKTMQLTKHTDYAFRTLIYLASMEEELTTIKVITEKFHMSRSHLMKIVNEMVNYGWIEAIRGKNGGIRLQAAPADINCADVVKKMEQTLAPVNCDQPPCDIIKVCKLKNILWQAQRGYLEHVGQFTLADLIDADTADVIRLMAAGD